MENKKHTQNVIAEPEVVKDEEFMLEPVPENKRRSTRSQIMVWIGFGYAVTGLIVGGASGIFAKCIGAATAYRDAHIRIFLLLPFAGLLIVFLYQKFLKN